MSMTEPGSLSLPLSQPRPTSRWLRVLFALAANIRVGELSVTAPNGQRHFFKGALPGPSAQLRIHRDRAARRLLLGGSLGFCEGYLDGDWSSQNLTALFELALQNEDYLDKSLDGHPWLRKISHLFHRLKPNTRSGSKKNIAAHYDLGNDFYGRWLDPSMTYSSAIYENLAAPEALESAQQRKYEALAQRLELKPGMHVLEVGCGWGGFAEYAARTYGVHVTGLTISPAQHAYATARIAKAGLADQVSILMCDYRDVQGEFDCIASIEMFEAVGEKYWPAYFSTLFNRLKPGGKAALQIITIADRWFASYRRGGDYIQRYIFPGGMLPSIPVLEKETAKQGLVWQGYTPFGLHYARTLRDWNTEFQRIWPQVRNTGKFDTRFRRLWEQYFCYCEAGFNMGTIDVIQLTLQRPQTP